MTSDPDHKASRLNAPDQHNHYVDMPLGSRKQAARTPNRALISKLMRDQDHRVIELLLQNPRLRESDVITIASRRPTRAAILETVANHRKWKSRYNVKVTICWNPHSPDYLVKELLPSLMQQDLKAIIDGGQLSEGSLSYANNLVRPENNKPEETT